jgi:hypothetical protein
MCLLHIKSTASAPKITHDVVKAHSPISLPSSMALQVDIGGYHANAVPATSPRLQLRVSSIWRSRDNRSGAEQHLYLVEALRQHCSPAAEPLSPPPPHTHHNVTIKCTVHCSRYAQHSMAQDGVTSNVERGRFAPLQLSLRNTG